MCTQHGTLRSQISPACPRDLLHGWQPPWTAHGVKCLPGYGLEIQFRFTLLSIKFYLKETLTITLIKSNVGGSLQSEAAWWLHFQETRDKLFQLLVMSPLLLYNGVWGLVMVSTSWRLRWVELSSSTSAWPTEQNPGIIRKERTKLEISRSDQSANDSLLSLYSNWSWQH